MFEDEFNSKLLMPDLSKKQLEDLHTEATVLYKEYFDAENASNFIGCSSQIVENFKKLLNEGVYHVAKFRTAEPLYQAYEHALNILENDLLPPFFHSNEVLIIDNICNMLLSRFCSFTATLVDLKSLLLIISQQQTSKLHTLYKFTNK